MTARSFRASLMRTSLMLVSCFAVLGCDQLPGRPKPGLLLESVSIPWQVFSGERFPVEVTLESVQALPFPLPEGWLQAKASAHTAR